MTAPMLLYKYMTEDRALACLPEVGDGALRATQPASLNDPFECHIAKKFIEKDEEEGNADFAHILTRLNPRTPMTAGQVAEARKRHGSLYMRELLALQASRRFGIVSFSSDPLHPLMWSHYTIDGSGLVIGYCAEKLRELGGAEECLFEVKYGIKPALIADYIVAVKPHSNLFKLLSFKSAHWEHEKEWRLIVELGETIGNGESDSHGQPINLLRIPNSAVAKVHFTERTPAETVDKIERCLGAENNRYGVRHASKLVLSADTYAYEQE